jgi:hypothetical protein
VESVKQGMPIHMLRQDAIAYLSLQLDCIPAKIKQENEACLLNPDKLVLVDRSLIDSWFYLTFYLDKAHLTRHHLEAYHSLATLVVDSLPNRYRALVLMAPRPITQDVLNDPWRPQNLDLVQKLEWDMIRTLSLGLVYDSGPDFPLFKLDTPVEDQQDWIERWLIGLMEPALGVQHIPAGKALQGEDFD